MKNNILFVSIIIPCHNEEKFIAKCLDSILDQDYPKDRIEIIVADGLSKDRTKEIVQNYSQKFSFIKVFDNPDKFTPFALNVGIKNSNGEIIFILGSHATYKKDYISKCVKYLLKYNADNVGGKMETLPSKNTLVAKAITFVLSNKFGAGNSYFRTGANKPKLVDTVFGGCYRKEVFEKIGYFNENLIRSQDMEFNLRLKKAGGKILLVSDIVACYYPKSNLKDFLIHNFNDGVWAIYPLKFVKMPLNLRHYIPLLFVLSLIIAGILSIFNVYFVCLFSLIIVFYLLTSLYFSVCIVLKEKNIKYLFVLPIVFAVRHIGYGLGSLWGLIKLFK